MADTRPFYLSGGKAGHRFVVDVGNAEFKEDPELNKPEPKPTTPTPTEPTEPTAPTVKEIPRDVEIVDPEDEKLKEQRERELKEKQERELKEQRERELKEKQERELKEKQERELKEKQERELKEQQERELKEQRKREKELKEQQERELKEKREREIKEQREREKELKEKEKREKKEREKLEKENKSKDKDKDEEKTVDTPFKDLADDLDKITNLKGRVIVIDPGHGGNDAGAIGPTGVMEKNVTLKVSLELKKLLEAEGAKVVMTRETDTTVSSKGAKASDIEELGARCEVANRIGAEIFISIHADSFTRPEARGTTGYYYSKSTTGRGQKLADCIRRNLVEQLGTPSRGTQPCNFYVVKNTDMPATLIELGFISNKEEEKLLDSKEGVMKAAQGIFDGIEDYFG
ncbi:MAG: N-acetylmuramoyl-L-alanine amidase [Selenomonadaceae bacterium]|nr:N-acetylmuramoyl-L-alanine amidase [Selenomonadaceae bacterium]